MARRRSQAQSSSTREEPPKKKARAEEVESEPDRESTAEDGTESNEPDPVLPLGTQEQLLLQSLMATKIFPKEKLRALVQRSNAIYCQNGDPVSDEALDDVIYKLREDVLKPIGLEIRKIRSEQDDLEYYGVTHEWVPPDEDEDDHDDPVSKLPSLYDPKTLTFFKAIVDKLLREPSGACGENEIVSNKFFPGASASASIEMLNSFRSDGWVVRDRSGMYSLSLQSILDLQSYIDLNVRNDDELDIECAICHEKSLQGTHCPSCNVRMHTRCHSRWFCTQDEHKCPSCNEVWPST